MSKIRINLLHPTNPSEILTVSVPQDATASWLVTVHSAILRPDPECPGEHDPLPVRTLELRTGELRTVGDLLAAVREQQQKGWIAPAEPIVLAAACTGCTAKCQVRAAESTWMMNPHCAECGGPWSVSRRSAPGLVRDIELDGEPDPETGLVELAELGLGPGGCMLVDPGEDSPYLLEIPGQQAFTRAS